MKRRRNQWLSGFLVIAMTGSSVLQASAYTKPQEAETQLHEGYAREESAYAIYPMPQSVTYPGGEFTLTETVNVVYEEGIDTYTKAFLEEILDNYGKKVQISSALDPAKSNILLGMESSEGVLGQWADQQSPVQTQDLFQKTDACLLDADDGTIAIMGKDTDAVYYGLATLQMMFSSFAGERFLNARIEDYASVATRGFIEGFYGGWSYDSRKSLMRFARDFKMNTYVYASKTDPYHKNGEPYPQSELDKIKDLVKVGKETKVEYAWSTHISWFFSSLSGLTVGSDAYNKGFEQNYDRLVYKLQQLYDVGVRKFDVLNDDFGAGAHTEVVRLLNRLDEEFLRPNACRRMSYCPQGYNQSWSGDGSELEVLKSLNDNIDIYWTGADVNSPITQETVDFLKKKTNHAPVFWLNYPVNEHAAKGIYLGNITHYARDGVNGLAGAISNPSQFAETNKVGLFQLAALFWNNNKYVENAELIWEEAFKYLQPEVYEAYLTIARNVSNCPGSGRVPAGFPESEYLKETLNAVAAKIEQGVSLREDQQAKELQQEFKHIQEAISVFRSQCSNQKLISELDPWLKSLKDIAVGGEAVLQSVMELQGGDADAAWKELGTASKAMDSQNTYPTLSGSDNMALAGSKYLVPFVSKAVIMAKNLLTPYFNPNSTDFTPSFYAVMGGKPQGDSSQSAKIFDGDPATFASYNIVQQKDDYFGVDLGRMLPVHSIQFLQGKTDADHDYFHNGCLEYSKDGVEWIKIASNVDMHKLYLQDIHIKARYIRLRLTAKGTASKPDYWSNIREIAINQTKENAFGVISSREEYQSLDVQMEDSTYTLREVKKAKLSPGEYLGIKMKELSGLEKILCRVQGAGEQLALEYSENGVIWKAVPKDVAGTAARYVRLYNGTGQELEFTVDELSVAVKMAAVRPSVADSSFPQLKEGTWENLFDNDTSTYIWTNTAQKTGQYILVDLGATVPVFDLRITTEDGNPRFYNAKIQVSADKESWQDVAEVVDGGKDAVRDNIFYRITKNLEGKKVRWLRILITGDSGYFLKINDIAINKSQETGSSTITSNLTGDLEKMIDGNISTVYAAKEVSDGAAYIEYKITEFTKRKAITILQDASAITNAEVKAVIYDGKQAQERTLGYLDKGSKTFTLSEEEDLLSVRITWPHGTTPVIYDIISELPAQGGGSEEETVFPEGKEVYKLGRESFPAVNAENGTAAAALPLPKTIEVTYQDKTTATLGIVWDYGDYRASQGGTYILRGYPEMPAGSYNHAGLYAEQPVTVEAAKDPDPNPDIEDGNLALNAPLRESGSGLQPVSDAADGNLDTRWEGNAIKGGAATTTSWIEADLGVGEISVNKIYVRFYVKTFATDYDVQASEDALNWETVKTIKNADSDTQNPVDEIVLDKPITKRYVRLFFRSMNTKAAGHAVGIRELEIIGSRKSGSVEPKECTCSIGDLKFADREATIPADAGQTQITLDGTASIKGNCEKEGHKDLKLEYQYEITEGASLASLSGNVLTVTGSGRVSVQMTVQLKGSEAAAASKTAVFTCKKQETPQTPEDPKPTLVTSIKAVIPVQSHTGKAITPAVKAEGYTQGKDYTVSYRNNINPGTALAVLTFRGAYTGSVQVTFEIAAAKGKSYTKGAFVYKITNADTAKGSAAVTKMVSAKKTSVSIPNQIKIGTFTYKVKEIAAKTFRGNKKLKTIKLGSNIEKIGARAFYGCTVLKSISIGSALKTIGARSFYGCRSLRKVSIKSVKLTKISKKAFAGIHKKADFRLPPKKKQAYSNMIRRAR